MALVCAFASDAAIAEDSPRRAPLPPSEALVYSKKTGAEIERVEMDTRLVREGKSEYYELRLSSPEEEGLFRLDSQSLLELSSDVTTKSADATIRRVTTVVENRAVPAKDEIIASGGADTLAQSLRAFPWDSARKAKISFMGAGKAGSAYRFDFNVTGKESLEVAGRRIECWKAQLSLDGLLGSFVGATKLWYSVEYPHYLVRSEGASGPPGSPETVLTLESYRSGSGD